MSTNWKLFWKAVDRFGERGAPRCEWRWALGDEFAQFEPLLKAGRTLADSIHDPDDATQALEIFEGSEGNFEAHSTEIPPHRGLLTMPRSELVMLTVNVPPLTKALAPELGFVPGEFRSRGHAGLHELGVCSVAGKAPRPVFLLLPNGGHRSTQLVETIINLRGGIVLLPSAGSIDERIRNAAAQREIIVRALDQDATRILSHIQSPSSAGSIKPVFLPSPGWTWDMLELDFSHEQFVATIAGQIFKGRWSQHGVRVLHNGRPTDFIKLLIRLAHRETIRQSRHDPSLRKRISRFREALRALFPLEGEPIKNGKAAFRLSTQLAKRAAQSWMDKKTDW